MSKHFDLIAIGAGSGGLSVVEKAALHGAKCAVVESGDVGDLRQSGLRTEKSDVVRCQSCSWFTPC